MSGAKATMAGQRLGELLVPDDADRAGELARAGALQRISHGLYTENLDEPVDRVARRNWLQAIALKQPGSVLIGRSAILAMPTDDGHIFLDAGERKREHQIEIGPLTLNLRPGPGRLPGDTDLAGVALSSRARAALDNLIPSRSRNAPSWTIPRKELEDWLVGLADRLGIEELNTIRDEARELAKDRGDDWANRYRQLDEVIGSIMGTRDAALSSDRASARRAGIPYDSTRLDRFDVLRNHLLANPTRSLPASDGVGEVEAFFESYFSNFIEGTEFTIEEASEIVFDGMVPADRPQDAHDILGTFRAANDSRRNSSVPDSADDLIAIAKQTNFLVLEQRREKGPGEFKERANRAGNTVFVEPDLVKGTLLAGWSYYESLPPGFARAVFMMFLIAEVHPFAEGNGRTARLMMNAELTAARTNRFIVPISYREDYLGSLRALSLNDNPAPIARMAERILAWVGSIDWTTRESAQVDLDAVRAFDDGVDARLRIP